jgi:hypothetical protein
MQSNFHLGGYAFKKHLRMMCLSLRLLSHQGLVGPYESDLGADALV